MPSPRRNTFISASRMLDSAGAERYALPVLMSTGMHPPLKAGRVGPKAGQRSVPRPTAPPIANLWWIPPALTLALLLISLTSRVQAQPIVLRSFWSVIGALVAWQVALYLLRGPRSLT